MADSSASRLAVIHRHLTKDSGTFIFYLCFIHNRHSRNFIPSGIGFLKPGVFVFSTFFQRVCWLVRLQTKTGFDISLSDKRVLTNLLHELLIIWSLCYAFWRRLCSHNCTIRRIVVFIKKSCFYLYFSWTTDEKAGPKVPSSIPKKRQELLRWNGWGYEDSGFVLNNLGTEQNPKYVFTFSGSRYEIASADLPHFYEWAYNTIGIQPSRKKDPQGEPNYPPPIVNEGIANFVRVICEFVITTLFLIGFVSELKNTNITFSFEGMDRLFRAHGHTLHDIALLRGGQFLRIPDVVVWPGEYCFLKKRLLPFKINCLTYLSITQNVTLMWKNW